MAVKGIHWLGHASFRLEGSQVVIYIDPWQISGGPAADVILVTHAHHDHLSIVDIAKVAQPKTVFICPASCAPSLKGDVRVIAPGGSLQVGDVLVEAVPSYNTNKPNHPQAAGNVGYIVETGGQRIYHAGDTDLIPEMAHMRCDVALLPVGGKYTMDAAEAAQAVAHIKPRIVVPMHWGSIVGSQKDVQILQRRLPQGVELAVLEPER
jgi:L-ascorbate metabolism protein UlaG (beta-lactamase superfamily)